MTQLPASRRTERKIRQLERLARQQGAAISCINLLMEFLMAGKEEEAAALASLRQAVVDDQASDQAVVTRLDDVIAQLRADGDTSAAIAAIEEIKSQITAVTSSNS